MQWRILSQIALQLAFLICAGDWSMESRVELVVVDSKVPKCVSVQALVVSVHFEMILNHRLHFHNLHYWRG